MQGKQGIIIAGGLIALVGIGVGLIMAIGVPQSTPTAIPGAAAPTGDPNAVGSLPPETGTAGDTTGNATGNQSQTGATTSGAPTSGGAESGLPTSGGGFYGGP